MTTSQPRRAIPVARLVGPTTGFIDTARPAFFALVVGLVMAFVIPHLFGDEIAVRGVARVYAPLLGASRGTDGRDDISVLLIDDRSLQRARQTWPASYGYYGRLLDAMVEHHPRAVFIDIAFAAQRDDPSLSRLINAACKARAAGTRVYLAARRDDTGSFALRPELQALVPRCVETVAIEYDPDALDQVAWTYRIQPEPTSEGPPIDSAAAAIYRGMGGRLPAQAHAPLAVNWGLEPAQSGIDWLVPTAEHGAARPEPSHGGGHGERTQATETDEPALSPYCRAPGHHLFETLPTVLRSHLDADAFKPICVFHHTLYPADLATASDEEERLLAFHLRDRVVMIGTALQGSNDRVTSPLHGSVPGVYLHAAALDNLLHYRDDYRRSAHLGGDADGLKGLLLLGVALIVMIVVKLGGRWLRLRLLPKPAAGAAPWKRRSLAASNALACKVTSLAVYAAFFSLMVYVGDRALHLGMLTVAHLALFAFLAEWLDWGEDLEHWWTGKASHAAHDGEPQPRRESALPIGSPPHHPPATNP